MNDTTKVNFTINELEEMLEKAIEAEANGEQEEVFQWTTPIEGTDESITVVITVGEDEE